ncbi:MAG: hypothetical protein ACR2MA_11080 [Egibacteraceae bacterium]
MYESTWAELRTASRLVNDWCHGFEPDELVRPADVHQVHATLARMAKLVEGAQTRLARRVEQTGVWRRHGAASAVAYLAGEQGVTTAVARQQLSTSRALPGLAATDQAVRRGELSAQQAAVVADAAQAAAAAQERARRGRDTRG